jgi:hypothetical protein
MEGLSSEKAEADLNAKLWAASAIDPDNTDPKRGQHKANAIAQNVLREELGHFGKFDGPSYDLTEGQRDLLLAHGRQDAAAAFVVASSALEAVNAMQTRMRGLRRLLWAILTISLLTWLATGCAMVLT